jgi:HD superfamily phosphodiesterase
LHRSVDWGNFTNTPVQHFHEKLQRLGSAMNTEPGRRRAQKRISQMREFIEAFEQDWKANQSF